MRLFKMIHHTALVLMIALYCISSNVSADQELTIEITSGADNATPIAIVPFRWQGQGVLPEDVAQIVQDDLQRSGQFKPLARGSMLSMPWQKKEVFFRDWRVSGVEYLVIGKIAPLGVQRYEISYELYDVVRGESLLTQSIVATDFRDGAHFVSDKVYEALTNIPGAFSTKIMYITYEKMRGGKSRYRLQRADADGHRYFTILESSEPIMSPTWSPSGKKIAYVSFHDDGKPAIYIQDIKTGKRDRITHFRGINGAPDWSPDGTKMAMSLSKDGNSEIYILDLVTKQFRRMTNHYAIDTEPRWAPSGNKIIFTSDRAGGPQIYELDVNNGSVRRLTFEGNYNARGDLTPDGRYLVYVHRAGRVFHIAVQDLQLGVFNTLTETVLDESPSIAPNGSMILYATQQGGQGILGAVSIDGRVKTRMPSKKGEVREPSWSPFLNR